MFFGTGSETIGNISLSSKHIKYVRFASSGNTVNTGVHVVEFSIFGENKQRITDITYPTTLSNGGALDGNKNANIIGDGEMYEDWRGTPPTSMEERVTADLERD